MTDNDLKKLSRAELLEILIKQATEIETLKAELEEAKNALNSRELRVGKAGSIAEASLLVSGVFESAQAAAEIYLENIRNTEEVCNKMRAEAETEAQRIIDEANAGAEKRELEAKLASERYWADVSGKLEKFYDEHSGLRSLLKIGNDTLNG